MYSYEEFLFFYEEKGYLPNDVSRRKNKLNDKQLKSRYEKYLRSEQKRQEALERYTSKDERWEELKSKKSLLTCELIDKLSLLGYQNAIEEIRGRAGHLYFIIDPAHVFGKGAYPHMKYDLDNVVPLNRYSHSMLDQNRDPISGEQISNEDKIDWWIFIIGNNKYQELLSRSTNGRD